MAHENEKPGEKDIFETDFEGPVLEGELDSDEMIVHDSRVDLARLLPPGIKNIDDPRSFGIGIGG